jgi:SagB-type dehydrogenase family enzyme
MEMLQEPFLILILIIISIGLLFFLRYAADKSHDSLSIGQRFHHDTMLTWTDPIEKIYLRIFKNKTGPYKTYTDTKRIILPESRHEYATLAAAVSRRQSRRNYTFKQISLDQLSGLLFASSGLSRGTRRTTPSAGATFPIETYVIVRNVEGLDPGIYHYHIQGHALDMIQSGDFSKDILNACQKQAVLRRVSAVIVFSSIFERVCRRYGERGYRYCYMEAGHMSQNVYLQAESLGLGTVGIGGFLDHRITQLLHLDGVSEAVVYMQAVGTL